MNDCCSSPSARPPFADGRNAPATDPQRNASSPSPCIVLVEDLPDDMELIEFMLRRAGLEFRLIPATNGTEFFAALRERPDLILADYYMSDFGAPCVLSTLAARNLGVPVIVVTGAVDEDDLQDKCLNLGATEYVTKDKLQSLAACVERVLKRHGSGRHGD
jgi:CheY-like chemotaxis protein